MSRRACQGSVGRARHIWRECGAPALAGVRRSRWQTTFGRKFDFDAQGIQSWTTRRRSMGRGGDGGGAQRQESTGPTATKNEFNVIVAPGGPTATSISR